jgi:raffinose/stachyose/melibiose transport system permease protein
VKAERTRAVVVGVIAIAVSIVVFLVPFFYVLLQASKTPADAQSLAFSWPQQWRLFQNLGDVLQANDGVILRAFINSTIVPPAVVPTIWVLQGLGLFKTMIGMILIEATFGLSFNILLFRAFVGTIPKDLDEAAVLDGSGPIRMFFRVILPLLRPVMVTVIVVQAVVVFNDFAGPLYFLPGDENATVQLTLFQFQGQSQSLYNLLFMDILLITIPPLVMFIFFNRQIVAGMTSGAVKG